MSNNEDKELYDPNKESPTVNRSRPIKSHLQSTSSRRSRSQSGSEIGECSDTDSPHDSEEYDHVKRKRKKKDRYGGFIIDEAEVGDEVEDDDDWEDGAQEIGIVGNEVDELGPTAREIERQRRATNFWDSQKEHDIEEYLRKKYSDDEAAARHFGDGGEEMSDEITQQTLLPGVKDPNLWLVKCRIGEEKATVLLLMRKFLAYQGQSEAFQIKSVVVSESVKGYIYIEAYKQSYVKAVIENVANLRVGLWKQQMVPIKEMTDVLRVVKEQTGLKKKQWVRLKRGLYKDDIAQVDYFDMAQKQVHLKLLPRIDYSKLRGALRTMQSEVDAEKHKKKHQPPSKPFDPEAIRAIGGEVTSDGDFLIFEGNRYSRKGFLYKNFNLGAILVAGVKPTLAELERFEEQPEAVDLEFPAEKQEAVVTHTFSAGDNVEVCQSELVNLQGKIVSIDGNMITIMPKHEELKDALVFQASELTKCFRMGDHVKVLLGRYEGDTGLVIRVEATHVVVISDLTIHEMEVLPKDLQLCTDMATGVDCLGKFEWGDLVNLDPETVGVIVRLESEIFHILTMHNKVVERRPSSLEKRKLHRITAALDAFRNCLHRKDMVKVIDGTNLGFLCKIKHLYRNFAFLHSLKCLENGGIFVCKTKQLQLAGGRTIAAAVDATTNVEYMSPCRNTPLHPSSGGYAEAASHSVRHYRDIVGTTIKIIRGPYKGNIGIIKDTSETTARVELHTSCHIISVDRNHILDAGTPGQNRNILSYARTPAYAGNHTPLYRDNGSKTPMAETGSRTPLHCGPATPIHDGSRTPNGQSVWDPTLSNSYPAQVFSLNTAGLPMSGPYTPEIARPMFSDFTTYGQYKPSPGYQVSTPSSLMGCSQSPSSLINPYSTPSTSYSPSMTYQTGGWGAENQKSKCDSPRTTESHPYSSTSFF